MEIHRTFRIDRDADGSIVATMTETQRLDALSSNELEALKSIRDDKFGWGDNRLYPVVDCFRLYSQGMLAPMGHGLYEITGLGLAVVSQIAQ